MTVQEQLDIIKDVQDQYSKILGTDFDPKNFIECKDNFKTTQHIESIKIFDMDNPPTQPTFTIAIPTYNRCETLQEAIESAIKQDVDEAYEILVVENVDNFDQPTCAQQMLENNYRGKIAYYKNKNNIGLYENLNRCILLSRGEWVCTLHSDDLIFPNYLTEMKKILQDIEYNQSTLIGNREYPYSRNIFYFFKHLLLGSKTMNDLSLDAPTKVVAPNALLHHRDRCISLGGYNPDEFPSADMLFYYRAYKYGKVYMYQKILQNKRKEWSLGEHPKTIVQFAIIDMLFIINYIKPKYFANVFASDYIRYYLDHYLYQYPILYDYINNQLASHKIKKYPRFYFKLCKFIYLFLNYKKRYF